MKKWFALLLAVLMLCVMTGCGDNTKPDDKDTPTTTTKQEVAPIELVEGKIPSDCYWTEDISAPARNMAVMIKANVNLTDVQWLALNPDPPTLDQVLDHRALKKDEIWAVNTYINDAVPNRGIACTDENGNTYYYAITWSGKDGSIRLTPLDIAALSDKELVAIEAFLNDEENNGFVAFNEYDCPEEVSLHDALYDIGVRHGDWTEEEIVAYMNATGQTNREEAFLRMIFRHDRAKTEALLQNKLGISITLTVDNMHMRYIEELDAFFDAHTDSGYRPVHPLCGWTEGGLYMVNYEIGHMGDTGRVTLKPTEDGYQFVSNHYTLPLPENTIYLSSEQLEKINTFLNGPDNLGFVQRTFDRPEEVQWIEVLTADVTFGVYETEWSDAERQALADYLEDTPGTANRYPRAKVEELFQKRLGLSPTELDTPISAHYSEEYDAYYRSFLGIEWVPIYVKSGKIENGIYIVDYSFDDHDATRRVTMRATDDGYQFISNVAIED